MSRLKKSRNITKTVIQSKHSTIGTEQYAICTLVHWLTAHSVYSSYIYSVIIHLNPATHPPRFYFRSYSWNKSYNRITRTVSSQLRQNNSDNSMSVRIILSTYHICMYIYRLPISHRNWAACYEVIVPVMK